ncbi:MAG: hypothetical protein JWN93_909, partial [Hyphomicrobiales bacterium]|nr:hypothetical protein [Hyphomicrobiales bacterium]
GTEICMRHPTQGDVMGVSCQVTADGERPRADMRAPPMLGEHTAEIFAELGLEAP